ncbi:hypothetical protein U0534_06300 [Bacillus atrophaeus]|uniref:hypothetical protein n=1 Tax=Bacillus atrophaeus TaxID=1452 RepID=UPI00308BAB78|nr:hypothetical protein U0534_06300 [Bacillus atrophaeus]
MNLLSHDDVLEILPQRYPFVMVDRVIEIGETKITTIKNVTGNEPCFQGHFPNKKDLSRSIYNRSYCTNSYSFVFKN